MDIALLRPPGGLMTRQQLLAGGVAGQRLTEWVRLGVVARVARGVYAVSGPPRTALDPHAITSSWRVVLSYSSAAAWWEIDLPHPVPLLHVTAPRNRHRGPHDVPGVRVHRAMLHRGDVVVARGLRVTSPLRTALDISRHASLEDAVAIVDAFLRKRLFTKQEWDAAARAAAGPGRTRIQLVATLADHKSGSILESLARVLLWRNGLLPPASQLLVRHGPIGWRGYVDFAWPTHKVVLECDGYEFHIARDVFISDRRRWSTLERAGWRVAVVTWFDVTGDPTYVVDLVRDLLGTAVAHTNAAAGASVTAA